jgi:hypothetical protein
MRVRALYALTLSMAALRRLEETQTNLSAARDATHAAQAELASVSENLARERASSAEAADTINQLKRRVQRMEELEGNLAKVVGEST